MIKRIVVFILFSIAFGHSVAQSERPKDYPVEGKLCPGFVLTEVDYYIKEQLSLSDIKGKWLILDFWTTRCTACIKSFSKINQLQKEFKSEIQFLLVGKSDRKYNKNIRILYEKFRRHQDLDLTIAYDSQLFEQFGVQTVPHIVVVDKKGIVRAITYGDEINKETLQALINDEKVLLEKKYNEFESIEETEVSLSKPLLINGNGGEDGDFLYRSLLMKWDDSIKPNVRTEIDNYIDEGCFQGTGMLLSWLYKYAYFGKNVWDFDDYFYGNYCQNPILEIEDSSFFKSDWGQEDELYNYSLIVPKAKATKEYLMKVMQNDLNSYFGYDVYLETRLVPCWKLIATAESKGKLQTKGEAQSFKGDHAGYTMVNVPISKLLRSIWATNQQEPSFINATDITSNIDITMDAIFSDLESIRSALRKNGLDLVKATKEMKVLVIKDPKKVASK
jgi:thiol-disulfide isomerase/thioredoxin